MKVYESEPIPKEENEGIRVFEKNLGPLEQSPFENPEPETRRKNPEIEAQLRESGDLEQAVKVTGDLAYSMRLTRGVTADVASQVVKISKETGIPEGTVRRNFKEAKDRAEAKKVMASLIEEEEYQEIIPTPYQDAGVVTRKRFKYPATVRRLADPSYMGRAKEDTNALIAMEAEIARNKMISDKQDDWPTTKIARQLGTGVLGIFASLAEAPALAIDLASVPFNKLADATGAEFLRSGAPEWLRNNPIGEYYRGLADQMRPLEFDTDIIGQVKEGNYVDAALSAAYQVAESLPTTIGIMYGSGILGLSKLKTLSTIGVIAGGGSYRQGLEQGKTPEQAALFGFGAGLAEMGFEGVTYDLFWDLGKDTIKKLGREKGTLFIKEFLTKLLINPINKEGAAEAGTTYVTALVDFMTGNRNALDNINRDSFNSYIVGGVMGQGFVVANYVANKIAKGAKVRRDMDSYEKTEKLVAETKMKQREDVEALEQFLEDYTDEVGAPKNVYIDLQVIKDHFDGDEAKVKEVTDALGVTDQVEKVEESKIELEIPKSKFLATYAGTDLAEAVKGDMRFSSGGMTINEQTEEAKQLANNAEVKKEIEKFRNAAEIPQKIVELKKQLVTPKSKGGLGRSAKEVNSALAIFMAGGRKLGNIQNKTLDQWLEDKNVRIKMGGDGVIKLQKGQTLDQWRAERNRRVIKETIEKRGATEDTSKLPATPDKAPRKYEELDPVSKEVADESINAFIDNVMVAEITEAEKGTRVFGAKKKGGEPEVTGKKSTFPSWWQEVGTYKDKKKIDKKGPSRADFAKAVEKKKGALYNRLAAKARELLEGGYESKTQGRIMPDNIYRALLNLPGVNEDGSIDETTFTEFQADELGFVSKLTEEVEGMKFKTMPAKDLANRLLKTEGIKKEEIEHSGIIDFLNAVDGKISRTEVLKFLEEGGVKVEQVVLSDKFKGREDNVDSEGIAYEDIDWTDEESIDFDYDSFYEGEWEYYNEKDNDMRIEAEKEIRKELEDELEEWENVDEREVERQLESWVQQRVQDAADEAASDPYNYESYHTFEVTESSTNTSIFRYGDGEWYSRDYPRLDLGYDLEEAKIRLIDRLIEEGEIEVPEQEETEEEETEVKEGDKKDVNAPVGKPRWESYKVEGGENYREFLITLPNLSKDYTKDVHFRGFKNFVAHTRTTDRIDKDGKKTLFIEEIQSDLHQDGREKGYELTNAELQKVQEEVSAIRNELNKISTSKAFEAVEKLESEAYEIAVEKDNISSKLYDLLRSEEHSALGKEQEVLRNKSDALTTEKEEIDKRIVELNKELGITELEKQEKELLAKTKGAIPNAPFKATDAWAILAFKRMLNVAVTEGYDAIAWTPAEVHIERWGTDSVSWKKTEDGKWKVGSVEQSGGMAGGVDIEAEARRRGELLEARGEDVTSLEELKEVLTDTLSRERGDRSLDSLAATIWKQMEQGVDGTKKPRAEGMEFFYDKMLPKVVGKYVKKLDKTVKVGRDKIEAGTKEFRRNEKLASMKLGDLKVDDLKWEAATSANTYYTYYTLVNKYGKTITIYTGGAYNIKKTEQEAIEAQEKIDKKDLAQLKDIFKSDQSLEDIANKNFSWSPAIERFTGESLERKQEEVTKEVWHVPITEKIKDKVLEGQVLFQADKKDQEGQKYLIRRGSVNFSDPTETVITLFNQATKATLIHEFSHIFFRDMRSLVMSGMADAALVKDYNTLMKFAGVGADGVFTQVHSENLSRGFEAYLREGVAPTEELTTAFGRFKGWLTAIYKSVKEDLGVEINDDVRGVFDRMLTSENEIDDVKRYYEGVKALQDILPATKKQKAKISKAGEKADNTAKAKQLSKKLKAYWKARKGGKQAVIDHAEKEIENIPIYKAIDEAIAEGGMDVENVSLNEQHPGVVGKEGKVTPEDLALKYEFNSPEDMLNKMSEVEGKESAIITRAAQLVAEEEAKFLENITSQEQIPGEEAYHNKDKMAHLLIEAEFLADQLAKEGAKRERKLEAKVFRDAAKEYIGKEKVSSATRYDLYAKREQKYAKMTRDLAEKGDILGAHEAQKRQIFLHALVQEAVRTREEIAKVENRYKATKLNGRIPNIEDAYRDIALTWIDRYKLGTGKINVPKTMPNVEKTDETLYAQIPEWILLDTKSTPYKTLTVKQLREVDQAIQDTMYVGGNELRSLKGAKFANTKELVDASVEAMQGIRDHREVGLDENDPGGSNTRKGKLLHKADGIVSRAKRLELIAERLDNYSFDKTQDFGPVRTLVVRGVNAEVEFQLLTQYYNTQAAETFDTFRAAGERLRAIHGSHYFDVKGVPTTAAMKRIGRNKWTSERIISFVLNLGSQSSADVMENAYGYTEEQVEKLKSQLTAKELYAIQKLIDITSSKFTEHNAVFFNMQNRNLTKVEAKEIKATSADGIEVTLKGGYYPLVFDHRLDNQAARNKAKSDAAAMEKLNRDANVYRRSTTKSGMNIDRVSGHSLPPKLDFGVWVNHVTDVARYISHTEYLSDFNRLTLNKEWEAMVVQKAGKNVYDTIRSSISYQALPERVKPDGEWEVVMDWFKNKSTLGILGLNASVALKQRVSLFNAAEEIGIKYLIKGAGATNIKTSILGLNSNTMEKIFKLSKFMRVRANNINREINDTLGKVNPLVKKYKIAGREFTWRDVQDFSFIFIQMNDAATVGVVWSGAFEKSLDENATLPEQERTDKAVAYADAIVRTTQPSSLPIDLSETQRAEGWLRLFTSFSTFTIGVYGNRLQHKYSAWRDGAITNTQYFRHVLFDTILPGWALKTIASALLYGEPPEPWELLTAPIETLIAWLPLVRDIPGYIQYGNALGTSPAFEGPNRALKAVASVKGSIMDDKDWSKAMWDTGRALELFLGVPALNVVKQMDRTIKIIEGKGGRK